LPETKCIVRDPLADITGMIMMRDQRSTLNERQWLQAFGFSAVPHVSLQPTPERGGRLFQTSVVGAAELLTVAGRDTCFGAALQAPAVIVFCKR
jgi:hypothetical protein